ncbi:hypothetical protein SUGI_0692430 [Cryptomeria japonica]|nr:hypothetical protein SUGI_0692430 [Cryptomeria japonica]
MASWGEDHHGYSSSPKSERTESSSEDLNGTANSPKPRQNCCALQPLTRVPSAVAFVALLLTTGERTLCLLLNSLITLSLWKLCNFIIFLLVFSGY